MSAIPTGELAALGAALCWALSSLVFERASAKIGAISVNLIRLVMAFFLLGSLGWLRHGHFVPIEFSPRDQLWLGVSGIVGFTIGDLCLFRALVLIGPRLATLLMALTPPITAVIGWVVLDERLGLVELAAMAITMGGIAMAILEQRPPGSGSGQDRRAPGGALGLGLLLGLGGAAGQAGGLVLSKYGMGSGDPFAATQLRVVAGILGFLVVVTAMGRWGRVRRALGDRAAMGQTAWGAIFGPVIGVGLSLVAVGHTSAGVAASIMATTPVLILPILIIVRRERVSPRAATGAVIAVTGVTLLFLQ